MIYGEALFHLGVGVMCAAAGLGVVFCAVFAISGGRLKRTLEEEYGPKRHT